jgi:two-component system, NtrC family, nitrogen regulation sensor histidine kinase NtrY
MGFDNFRTNIVLRIVALLGNIFVLVWGYVNTDWQMTPIVCAILLVLQILELGYYLEKTNRHFTAFLNSITERDFSIHYNLDNKGESFGALSHAFNRITATMQQLNAERAANHQLLEALIEHVSIALLCIDDNGKIILMNRSAKRLFNFPYIYHAFALRKVDEQLPTLVDEAVPGESQLIRIRLGGQLQPLSMFTTKFDLLEHTYSLVSLQNIRDELESRELDSWQKLIKVLTHEIMNSVTPIVSLSSVIKEALVNDSGLLTIASLTGDEKMDLVRSLLAIETRGKGLMRFVQSYNNLANIPKPYFTNVAVAALLERTSVLMLPELETSGITLETACEPSNLSLHADTQQVEQILINLVKNAKEAMLGQEQGHISIAAGINHDRSVQITVKDNGSGIAPDKLQDIFIPFYTSKTEGSGIGLSISRQLMLVNKGRIWVNSEVGAGTEFTLMFQPGI